MCFINFSFSPKLQTEQGNGINHLHDKIDLNLESCNCPNPSPLCLACVAILSFEEYLLIVRQCGSVIVSKIYSKSDPFEIVGRFRVASPSSNSVSSLENPSITCAVCYEVTIDQQIEWVLWTGWTNHTLVRSVLDIQRKSAIAPVVPNQSLRKEVNLEEEPLCLTHGGKNFWVGGSRGHIFAISPTTGEVEWAAKGKFQSVNQIEFHPYSSDLWFSSSSSPNLSVLDSEQKNFISVKTRHRSPVVSLSFSSPPYFFVISGAQTGTIFISNAFTLEYVQFIEPTSYSPLSTLCSVGNRGLVGAYSDKNDGVLQVWIDSWRAAMERTSHYQRNTGDFLVAVQHCSPALPEGVVVCASACVGKWICSVLADGRVIAWDTEVMETEESKKKEKGVKEEKQAVPGELPLLSRPFR